MKQNRVKRVILFFIVVLIAAAGWFVWPRMPIITAFAAKGMCSSIFLADKEQERVQAEDLSFFPISLAKSVVDFDEKSVTSTVFGLAKRKAIYREGLGAVLVLDSPENELKKSEFQLPFPGYSQDTISWPKGDLLPDTLPEGLDVARLNELLDTCFDEAGSEPFKKTLGIAVVYNNQLVAEKYLNGYNYKTMFHGWSMTKSITGALAGILADEGKLNAGEPAGFEEWQSDERRKITVKDIIQMSSGLDWYENYFTISDATVMLMQNDDMLASILDNKVKYEPGSFWNYSSGDANLLSGIIRNRMNNDESYHKFIYTKLLYPTGMLHTKVETDAAGLFVASSYSYGSTRDWARFGMLFLNEGVFAGDTVISKSWVDFMKTPATASDGNYAGTFWLKESNPENALLDIPHDVFFADGFLGQRIYIIPSKKLVVVRMGYGYSNFDLNNFLSGIIETLPVE
ncbi:serine hydrolase domain-containing protein [Maribellus maritimus]|uniref:serine hydrolase domain-containing protein n=1 Tax=Maribellus maritimus TaxID=2870838 RepID=UPI001EEA244A|nr:serine hydrolase [Maribellus maritimus]MCG6188619.1 beta-lactamase family protein [Maribellus maritimus]